MFLFQEKVYQKSIYIGILVICWFFIITTSTYAQYIYVLNDPDAVPLFGHSAVLLSDGNQFRYFSKDGERYKISGTDKNSYGLFPYNSKEEAFQALVKLGYTRTLKISVLWASEYDILSTARTKISIITKSSGDEKISCQKQFLFYSSPSYDDHNNYLNIGTPSASP